MALNSLGLGVTLTARDMMSGVLYRVQRAFRGVEMSSQAAIAAVSGGFGAMAAGIGVLVAGLGQLEAAFDLAGAAGKFEQDVTRAGMIAGTTDFSQLRDAALDAAQSTPFKPDQAIAALQDIAAMGFTAAQSVAMLRPALDLATGGGIGVASAASSMAAAMKVFGLSVDQAVPTADKLLHIANITGLQAKDLENALGTVGRGASATKQSLDEMLISMGLVKNTGVHASVAASSVSSALTFMSSRAEGFKKLGVSLVDANGNFREFLDIVLDTNAALNQQGLDGAERTAMLTKLVGRFGMTAFQAISTQLASGILNESTGQTLYLADAVAYLRDQMANAGGTAERFNEALLNTYEGAKKLIGTNLEVFFIALGDAFAEVLTPVLKAAVVGLREVTNIIRDLPRPVKLFAAGMFLTSGILTTVAGAALFTAGAFSLLLGAVLLLGTPALAAVASFMLVAAPLVLLAAGLTAAFLAFGGTLGYVFTKDLGGATTKIREKLGQWHTMFQSVLTFFTEGKISGALADEFNKLDANQQSFVVKAVLFLEKLEAAWDGFKTRFDELMSQRIGPILDKLWDSFMRIASAIGLVDNEFLTMSEDMSKSDFWDKGVTTAEIMAGAFEDLANAIKTVNNLIAWTLKAFGVLWDGFKAVSTAFFGMFTGPMGNLFTWAVGKIAFNEMIDEAQGDGFFNNEGSRRAWANFGRGQQTQTQSTSDTSRSAWAGFGGGQPTQTQLTSDTSPATAEAEGMSVAAAAHRQAIADILDEWSKIQEKAGPPPPILLQIDGETIARAVRRAERAHGAHSFTSEIPWSE